MSEFDEFCRDVFAPLGRADQRRAAKTYLYGLLHCSGRKSIRGLAALAAGRSEQSLQQFINQSPWDAEPVRQRVMSHLIQAVRPTAWAIEEVAFVKNGQYSAAVDRQYVRSLGRVSNCQLAIAVVLVAGQLSVPVNWRLLVPEAWGRDLERRARARMPDHELPRPYWQYHIEVLDDMALEWGMPAAPLLVDTRQRGSGDAFLCALELRRQRYVAQVSPSQMVGFARPQQRPGQGASGPSSPPATGEWWGTASELVVRIPGLSRETIEWRREEHGGILRSQFLRVPVRLTAGEGEARPADPPARLLIAEWPLSKTRPRGFWITNVVDWSLSEVVAMAKQREQIIPRLEELAGEFGLRDYEGRTFAGWHHHVTLATAAGVFQALGRISSDGPASEPVPEPIGDAARRQGQSGRSIRALTGP